MDSIIIISIPGEQPAVGLVLFLKPSPCSSSVTLADYGCSEGLRPEDGVVEMKSYLGSSSPFSIETFHTTASRYNQYFQDEVVGTYLIIFRRERCYFFKLSSLLLIYIQEVYVFFRSVVLHSFLSLSYLVDSCTV